MGSAVTLQVAENIILENTITTVTSIIKKATNVAPAFSVQEVHAAFSVANDASIFFRKKIQSPRKRLCNS